MYTFWGSRICGWKGTVKGCRGQILIVMVQYANRITATAGMQWIPIEQTLTILKQ